MLGYVVHGQQEEADGSGLNQRLRGNLMPAYNSFEGTHKEDRAKLFGEMGQEIQQGQQAWEVSTPTVGVANTPGS